MSSDNESDTIGTGNLVIQDMDGLQQDEEDEDDDYDGLDEEEDDDITINTEGGGSMKIILNPGGSRDKKAHHNALERRRRDHIKDSFTSLKDCIPVGSIIIEKPSRAHILNKATAYIDEMRRKNISHQEEIEAIHRQNDALERQIIKLETVYATVNSDKFDKIMGTSEGRSLLASIQDTTVGAGDFQTGTKRSGVPWWDVEPSDDETSVTSNNVSSPRGPSFKVLRYDGLSLD